MDHIIYVALLNEGTSVWRPVKAHHILDNIYLITGQNSNPDDEHWEFSCGDKVHCYPKTFSDGSVGLVAKKKAS